MPGSLVKDISSALPAGPDCLPAARGQGGMVPWQSLVAVPVPLPPRQRSCASLPERRGTLGLLFTGKIILERGKEVLDDWDAPRSLQQLLASPAANVGDICVVEGEAKDPVHPWKVAPEIACSVGS